MKRLIKNKSGQHTVGLPFSVIFSIFLIVVFIVVAFIAVKHFLDIGECAGVGQFYDNFQGKVDEAWVSQQFSESEYKIDTASGIKKVCFANLSAQISDEESPEYLEIKDFEFYEVNTFVIPSQKSEGLPYKNIKNIDINRITETRNPYCVDVSRGLRIQKGIYDKFVLIS